jgi:hypothetical protein
MINLLNVATNVPAILVLAFFGSASDAVSRHCVRSQLSSSS